MVGSGKTKVSEGGYNTTHLDTILSTKTWMKMKEKEKENEAKDD